MNMTQSIIPVGEQQRVARQRLGEEVSRIQVEPRRWAVQNRVEAGFCQLHDSRSQEPSTNRYYAVGGPGIQDLQHSQCSRRADGNLYYCMFDLLEYGQDEYLQCTQLLSRLKAQVKVRTLEPLHQLARYCGDEERYWRVRGDVRWTSRQEIIDLSCPTPRCATDEYVCELQAAAPVVSHPDQVEFIYDSQACSGRVIGVLHSGVPYTFRYTPEEFIAAGGFARVAILLI